MTTVSVLGTGIMGSGMTRSLLRAGMQVRAWNRTTEKAQVLEADGACVMTAAADAIRDADVVVTVLFDAAATQSVMSDALKAMRPDAVWVQCGTVGVEGTGALAALAHERGIGYVDAPVLGTKKPADDGTLVVLGAAPQRLRGPVAPILDAIGARTIWVGDRPGDGHRLKLVANSWVLSITGATAQAVAFARNLGLDPKLFLEAIGGGATDSPYAQLKGSMMIDGKFPVSFPVEGAVKDAALITEAMRSCRTNEALMNAVHQCFRTASDQDHADEDMAAVVHTFSGG